MVKLSYSFKLKVSFQEVWNYFSNFQNIKDYDPCVKSITKNSQGKNKLGQIYDLTTIVNGKQSKMTYEVIQFNTNKEGQFRKFSIKVYGSNSKVQSTDHIIINQISHDQNDFNVILQYKADLSLRGIYWLATIFVLETFEKIAKQAQKGAKMICIKNWGQNCLQKYAKQ